MAIEKGCTANFNTLQQAMDAGDVCLLECREAGTDIKAVLICAVNKVHDEYQMAPLARMIDGDPFELFDPPAPEDVSDDAIDVMLRD